MRPPFYSFTTAIITAGWVPTHRMPRTLALVSTVPFSPVHTRVELGYFQLYTRIYEIQQLVNSVEEIEPNTARERYLTRVIIVCLIFQRLFAMGVYLN